MTKLTPAQAYANQVKADRRAAAAERRGTTIQADNARVAKMFKKATPTKTNPIEETVYTLAELDQIPDEEARNRAYQLAALWPIAVPSVPFPGVLYGQDRMSRTKEGNWYVNGNDLPADLPAMCRNREGSLTQEVGSSVYMQPGHQGYRYHTVTVKTALGRIKRGKELFNYGA